MMIRNFNENQKTLKKKYSIDSNKIKPIRSNLSNFSKDTTSNTIQSNPLNNSTKFHITTLKSSKLFQPRRVQIKQQKPIIKLINQNISINNIVTNSSTNNITVNNFNTNYVNIPEDKRHRKSISLIVEDVRPKEIVKQKTPPESCNSSVTMEVPNDTERKTFSKYIISEDNNNNLVEVINNISESLNNSINDLIHTKKESPTSMIPDNDCISDSIYH